MSEAKFTKGEWVIGGTCHEDFRNCVCIDAQSRNVNTPTELAVIFGVDDGFTSDEESIANAHLIAAAPRTYNAADALIRSIMKRYNLRSIDELKCPLMRELALSTVAARGEA